jgi:hypothetical protein
VQTAELLLPGVQQQASFPLIPCQEQPGGAVQPLSSGPLRLLEQLLATVKWKVQVPLGIILAAAAQR